MTNGLSRQYQEIQDQIHMLRLQSSALVGDMIKLGMREIFDRYPNVESIGWRQYTPYWNDGAPCVFRANVEDPFVNGEYIWDLEDEDETLADAAELAVNLLLGINKLDLLDLYGDHAEITFARDGNTYIEICNHD